MLTEAQITPRDSLRLQLVNVTEFPLTTFRQLLQDILKNLQIDFVLGMKIVYVAFICVVSI